MEFKGTQGEWYIRYMSQTGIDNRACDMFVEAIEPKSNIGKIEIMMEDFGEHSGYPREQKLADAKLISAAPNLLKSCQEMWAWIVKQDDWRGEDPIKEWKESIDKALK